jgi:mitogen-activated protein kinase 7
MTSPDPRAPNAGSDHVQQLNCILAVLGTPEQSQLTHVPPKARQYIAALPPTAGKPLTDIYPAATEPAIELLTVMLHWEPSKRCTIEEALAHPYLSAFHNPAAEPIAAVIFDFDVQEELEPKMALFREVCRFRPDLAEHAAQVYADPQRAKRSRQGSRSVAPPADAAAYAQNLPRYGEHQHSQMEQQPSVAQMAAPASV